MKKLLFWLLIAQLLAVGTVMADKKVYVVGVEPRQNPIMVAEQWLPFLRDLSNLSDIELRFRTSRDVLEYNRAIKNGEFDFVINSPYLTTVFLQKYGISPIAKLHHVTDVQGLALIGMQTRLASDIGPDITIGVVESQRHAELQSISQYLSQLKVSYRVETYRTHYEVIEAVREGLSQFGIVQYQSQHTRDRVSDAGLDILWVDEQSKISYLSTMLTNDNETLSEIKAVLASGHNELLWARQHGIAQIEVLGGILSEEPAKAISLVTK